MHVHTGIKIFSPCSYRYVAIYNNVACVRSKHDDHDDNKMNHTLAFVNILLVKIFQH